MQKVSAATARPQQRPAGKQPVSQSQRPKPKTDHESFKEEDTENVSDFLGIVSAGLTVFSMIVGAKAQQAYELAENEEDQKKNKKKFDKSQTMQLDAAAVAIHAEGVAAGVAEIAVLCCWICCDRKPERTASTAAARCATRFALSVG